MNATQILSKLDEIANVSSKLAKVSLIRSQQRDEDFTRVLRAAYCPFTRYYVTSNSLPEAVGTETSSLHSLSDQLRHPIYGDMLDALSKRKVTGGDAIAAVEYITKNDAELLTLIHRIVNKDLRAGFSASTINKAIPKLVPTFDVMLAAKYKEKDVVWPQIASPKIDGARAIAILESEDVNIYTRTGQLFTTIPDRMKQAIKVMLEISKDYALDGELIAGSFNESMSALRKKDVIAENAQFMAFDLFSLQDQRSGNKTAREDSLCQIDRLLVLSDMHQHLYHKRHELTDVVQLVGYEFVHDYDSARDLYTRYRDAGYEGLMLKAPDGQYHFRRNKAWMKLKPEETHDLFIVDYIEGEGKYKGMLGAFVVEYGDNTVNVGTGLTDAQREEYWQLGDSMLGRIIEISAVEESSNSDGRKSLRHPVFQQFRDTAENPGEKI